MGHTDRAALIATVKQLWINANRLCDRQLGGTYESDCRLSLKRAEPAIDAIAALLEAEAWQPIATAPRDGTPILGGWFALDQREAGILPVSIKPWGDGWIDAGYWNDNDAAPLIEPTHWKPQPAAPPLPAPPVTEAKA